MKKSIVLVCSMIVALMGYSCSSDDNTPEETNLIGEWQLEAVDFSYINENVINGEPHPVYRTDFCVMEYIAGFIFKEEKNFIFIVTHDLFNTNHGLSPKGDKIWNWDGDKENFTIDQPNPSHTNGYVFAPKTISNRKIEKVGDKWQLTFDAELHLGSKASFTLVKKEIDRLNHRPTLTDNKVLKKPCGLLDFLIKD